MTWASAGRRGHIAQLVILWSALASVLFTLSGCELFRTEPRTEAPVALGKEPEVRVRVVPGASALTFGGASRVVLRPISGGVASTVPAPVTIEMTAQGLRAKPAGAAPITWPFGTDIEVIPQASWTSAGTSSPSRAGSTPASTTVTINGTMYPGLAQVRGRWNASASDEATLDAICVMPIESYLPGVLSKELIKGWPRQSYEAQAIAARSYALHERRRARSLGKAWDLESDTSDQVFGGITTDRASVEAARATRGRVLVDSAGELVRAYFSSTCGGRPVSASDAFGTPRGQEFNRAAPLQARARPHACQAASLYRWTIDRSDADLSRRLRTWGQFNGHEVRSLSLVRSIEPARANSAGRPIDYRVSDDRGRTFTLRAEQLRLAMNQSVEGLPNVTRETRANSGDVEVSFSGGRATIRGRGFGHGVGLCQWCARGFALEGRDASQILALMYPGSRVRQTF